MIVYITPLVLLLCCESFVLKSRARFFCVEKKNLQTSCKRLILSSADDTKSTADFDGIASDPSLLPHPKMPFRAYLSLLIVPMVWGTYSPLVKLIYSGDAATSAPPLVFNLLSYIVSFLSLDIATNTYNMMRPGSERKYVRITSNEFTKGFQLGLLLFLGSTFQIFGIQSTSAVASAFLVQLTTIIVPIIEISSRGVIPLKLLGASLIALIGVFVITVGPESATTKIATGTGYSDVIGKALVIIAAVFYSIHVVRLGSVVQKKGVSSTGIVRAKALSELLISITSLVFISTLDPNNESRKYINDLFSPTGLSLLNPRLVAVILWNGAAATALTTWAQAYGQKFASPTVANLCYTMQPIWSALFARVVLGDKLDSSTIMGGLLILLALVTAGTIDVNVAPSSTAESGNARRS